MSIWRSGSKRRRLDETESRMRVSRPAFSFVGWAKRSVPTMDDTAGGEMVGTLRFAHPKLRNPPRLPHRRQHDIGGTRAGRLVAGRHDAVDLAEGFELRPPKLGVAEHVAQRGGELFRGAVFLQEFGND